MVSRQGAIVIFVKTPGYSPLKTRLAQTIGQAQAEQFHRLSASAVAAVVQSVVQQKQVTPYWAVAEEAALEDPLWNQFETIFQGTGDLGTRLAHVNQVLSKKYDFVIFLGADTPQLPVAYLTDAIDLLSNVAEQRQFVMGPADDGGFYLFGTPICLSQETWLNVPYSAANTSEKLLEQLEGQGDIHQLPSLTDVDTVRELQTLIQEESDEKTLLPEQRQVIDWIQQQNFPVSE
ncbi:TIGR04282 family arsenosugar biosynthesis glycosyltransferase [uncultured Gimesia sp.]|uniref:TIGR04282 family arsenosugar biosynthesis glycosyltransferase n=1 Tax=uncultured Gimesia sp. TaxID=1678688 RepID=UPI0030D725D9|tara:strand:- start:8087 stop:8785 length:699 start_codon:yes stop_codon:yes gene_type:complete